MLTVLVCTRGRPHLLGECVASITADLPTGGELLVVERVEGDDPAPLPDFDGGAGGATVRHAVTRTRGKSHQLNEGLRMAAHDLVVITDDDCRVPPGWLEAMAAPFADRSVGAVFGPVRGLSSVKDHPQAHLPGGPAPDETWNFANGAAMAVRRSAGFAVGGFDERLGPGAPVHGEEHDLVLRLREAGWSVWIASAPAIEHLEWRDDAENRQNLLTYSRGAGAFLGAALRRAPARWARTVVRRLRFQARLWRFADREGWAFGPATTWAFLRGLVHGLRLRPERYLAPLAGRSVDEAPGAGGAPGTGGQPP